MKKRVIVAMSGGVDSSVSAALLQREGYDCIGIHLHFWTDPASGTGSVGVSGASAKGASCAKNKCCTLDGLEDARRVCEFLGIPFYVMNVEPQFKVKVVDYFLEGYARGETPNPCVECNRHIKFGDLWKRAQELEADFLASGHYARVIHNSQGGEPELHMAADKRKDQSYFLYTLTAEKLRHILFPIGSMEKTEVYRLADEFGLPRVIEKPESQGLCFFAEGNPKSFLQRYLPASHFCPGPILSQEGKVLGMHRGLPMYTIGQRQGLGIGGISGEPEGEGWYVLSMDRAKNALIVGREKSVLFDKLVCRSVSFVSAQAPEGRSMVSVRIRHRGALTPAVLEMREGKAFLTAEGGFKAPSKGQSAIFYEGERVVGGGVIEATQASLTNQARQEGAILSRL